MSALSFASRTRAWSARFGRGRYASAFVGRASCFHTLALQNGQSHTPGTLTPRRSSPQLRPKSPFLSASAIPPTSVPPLPTSLAYHPSPLGDNGLSAYPLDARDIPGFYVVIPAGGAGEYKSSQQRRILTSCRYSSLASQPREPPQVPPRLDSFRPFPHSGDLGPSHSSRLARAHHSRRRPRPC